MKSRNHVYCSLTRISDLANGDFDLQPLPRNEWDNADYVGAVVNRPANLLFIELPTGRAMKPLSGDLLIGAFGSRHATLELTGSWTEIGEDGKMSVISAAGLMGAETSRSAFITSPISVTYAGHVIRNGRKVTMNDFVVKTPHVPYEIPTVAVVGTSMSAGKTYSARLVVQALKQSGLKVAAAKLSGAGRYRDVVSMKDVGADDIFDFVDVGLPSSICPRELFRERIDILMSRMAATKPDVAVVEIGASPLEPYNGDIAIDLLADWIRFTLLCASDPYAVVGVIQAFGLEPDLVSGIATNTFGGVDLIKKLSGLQGLNLLEPANHSAFRNMLSEKLHMPIAAPDTPINHIHGVHEFTPHP
jgi:hypothetical protein